MFQNEQDAIQAGNEFLAVIGRNRSNIESQFLSMRDRGCGDPVVLLLEVKSDPSARAIATRFLSMSCPDMDEKIASARDQEEVYLITAIRREDAPTILLPHWPQFLERIVAEEPGRFWTLAFARGEVLAFSYGIPPVITDHIDLREISKSVCVLHKIPTDGPPKALGTGFCFMERDLVATAKHIMEHHSDAWPRYHLAIQPVNSTEAFTAVDCCYHLEQDLALLRLDRPLDVTPLRPCFETKSGFAVICYDPPSGSIATRFIPRFFTPPAWEGKKSTIRFFEWVGELNGGNSGAPVIGSDGGVAGVVSGYPLQVDVSGQKPPQSEARAVWIDPLMELYGILKSDPDSVQRTESPFRD